VAYRVVEKKLNDRHAEVLTRIRDAATVDAVPVHPCSSPWDFLVDRGTAMKLLRSVRGLYAQFGLVPPQLCPDLLAEIDSLPV
jgi:hypothetical protein